MKTYSAPSDLFQDLCPTMWATLTEDEQTELENALDFTGLELHADIDTVETVDAISGDVLSVDTLPAFVAYSISWAKEEVAQNA